MDSANRRPRPARERGNENRLTQSKPRTYIRKKREGAGKETHSASQTQSVPACEGRVPRNRHMAQLVIVLMMARQMEPCSRLWQDRRSRLCCEGSSRKRRLAKAAMQDAGANRIRGHRCGSTRRCNDIGKRQGATKSPHWPLAPRRTHQTTGAGPCGRSAIDQGATQTTCAGPCGRKQTADDGRAVSHLNTSMLKRTLARRGGRTRCLMTSSS